MKNTKKQNKDTWWQPAVFMFFRVSIWIAAPVLIGLFLGKWLDKRYDSEPWLFLLCIGIAFIFSMVGLVKNARDEFAKIEKDTEKSKK